MDCVICRGNSAEGGFRTLSSKVCVKFNHGYTRIHGVSAVDLDLVIVLGKNRKRGEADCQDEKQFSQHQSYSTTGVCFLKLGLSQQRTPSRTTAARNKEGRVIRGPLYTFSFCTFK